VHARQQRDTAGGPNARRERFERLYRAHCDDILRYAVRRIETDAVWDVVEETFLVAWRRLEQITESDELAWLYGTARKMIGQELRSRRRRDALHERLRALPDADAWLNDHADGVTTRIQLLSALERLQPQHREALMLVAWERLDHVTAARVAGCSVTAFRVRLHRARRRLAAALEPPADTASAPPAAAVASEEFS
jgi:RNA polymerase sigma factor (sigma-70 family)